MVSATASALKKFSSVARSSATTNLSVRFLTVNRNSPRMPYTPFMPFRESSSESAASQPPQKDNLWGRISEGGRLDELWSQFSADTRARYSFYGNDGAWYEISRLPKWHRPP